VATRFENNWHQVIVGPYPTRAEAEAARGSLLLQGFSEIRITPTTVAP
jgi:cell division protein FtsN